MLPVPCCLVNQLEKSGGMQDGKIQGLITDYLLQGLCDQLSYRSVYDHLVASAKHVISIHSAERNANNRASYCATQSEFLFSVYK